jgi:hypothetical protein
MRKHFKNMARNSSMKKDVDTTNGNNFGKGKKCNDRKTKQIEWLTSILTNDISSQENRFTARGAETYRCLHASPLLPLFGGIMWECGKAIAGIENTLLNIEKLL